MPWAVSLHLGDNKLFIRPKLSIYVFFMILIVFYSMLLFVCQICHVNCQAEHRNEIYLKQFLSNAFPDESYFTIATEEHLSTDEQRFFTVSRAMQETTSFLNVERTSTTKSGRRPEKLDQIGQQLGNLVIPNTNGLRNSHSIKIVRQKF